MKNGKSQCKDIPTRPILEFLAKRGGIGCVWWELSYPSFARSVRTVMPPVPDNLALAKMRQLMRKGLVSGCGCGCRGDFELTEKGRIRLRRCDGRQDAESEGHPGA